MSAVNFDQSTWLAYRVQAAQEMGPPPPARMVALPGAKAAIAHDHLLAHHDTGKDERQIVERVNAKWADANREQTEQHAEWVAGTYAHAIEEMRRRAAEETAAEMRKQALFAEMLKEREADGRSS